MTDKEKLEQLEKEAATLHNEKLSLVGYYTQVVKDNDITKQIDIENKWKKLSQSIKSTNKRIVLLKEQSDELNDPLTKLYEAFKYRPSRNWEVKKICGDISREIRVFPAFNQFNNDELNDIYEIIKDNIDIITDWFIDCELDGKLGAYIKVVKK